MPQPSGRTGRALLMLLPLALSACGMFTEWAYYNLQSTQVAACERQPTQAQRNECMRHVPPERSRYEAARQPPAEPAPRAGPGDGPARQAAQRPPAVTVD